MHNWSTDTKKLSQNSESYAIWGLEQMINFGLDGQAIKAGELEKYWDRLSIDPARRQFLDLLLHGNNHPHPTPNHRS